MAVKPWSRLHTLNQPGYKAMTHVQRRDPWVLPVEAGARQAALRAKQGLAQGAGGASDHLALVKAFNGWSAARRAGQERAFCNANSLSSSTMMMINGMRSQLLGELQVSHAIVFCIHSSDAAR